MTNAPLFPADGPSMPDPTVFVATWRATSRLNERVAVLSITERRVVIQMTPAPPSSAPSPHLRRTIAVPGPLHPRILPRNPRVQRPWCYACTAMVRRRPLRSPDAGGLRWVVVRIRILSPPLRRFFPQIATGSKEFINLQAFFMDKIVNIFSFCKRAAWNSHFPTSHGKTESIGVDRDATH